MKRKKEKKLKLLKTTIASLNFQELRFAMAGQECDLTADCQTNDPENCPVGTKYWDNSSF